LQFKLLKNPVFAGQESKVILLETIKLSYLFRSFLKSLNSRHRPEILTSSIGDGPPWNPEIWTHSHFGPDASQTLFLQWSSKCFKWSRSLVLQLNVIGLSVVSFTQKFATGKLNLNEMLIILLFV
jgi:hypothetical protein